LNTSHRPGVKARTAELYEFKTPILSETAKVELANLEEAPLKKTIHTQKPATLERVCLTQLESYLKDLRILNRVIIYISSLNELSELIQTETETITITQTIFEQEVFVFKDLRTEVKVTYPYTIILEEERYEENVQAS
jgi:hypothetical protein